MRFAIDTPNFGMYADPRLLAQLAREAEDAGWDGFFLWDHIGADWPYPVGDPWVQLTAMAMVLGVYERAAPDIALRLADYAAAGVTWWLECFDWEDSLEAIHARIQQGPPQLA